MKNFIVELKIKFPDWYDDPDGGDTFWLVK